MIDVKMEISSLFLALRLAKQVEACREKGEDDFTLLRRFAEIIREYEKGESNK